ncbi:PPE domain-containing protein, partial [Mycobacterium avium]|uniref:PPE domain-containing protein n=1 Tax=Mycobacterium avium TaxID=1764 RepID=UPI0012DA1585
MRWWRPLRRPARRWSAAAVPGRPWGPAVAPRPLAPPPPPTPGLSCVNEPGQQPGRGAHRNAASAPGGPGAGAASGVADASARRTVAAELKPAALSSGKVATALAGGEWLVSASASRASAVAPYVGWMSTKAAQDEAPTAQERLPLSRGADFIPGAPAPGPPGADAAFRCAPRPGCCPGSFTQLNPGVGGGGGANGRGATAGPHGR